MSGSFIELYCTVFSCLFSNLRKCQLQSDVCRLPFTTYPSERNHYPAISTHARTLEAVIWNQVTSPSSSDSKLVQKSVLHAQSCCFVYTQPIAIFDVLLTSRERPSPIT